MVGSYAGVIGPWSKGAKKFSEEQTGEREDGCNKGAGPAASKVGELRNRLGKKNLNSVALEVAQNGGAENRCDDDQAEKADTDIVVNIGVRSVEENLAVGITDRAEAFAGNSKKIKGKPKEKVDVSRKALEAKFELKGKELPEHGHVVFSCAGLVFCLIREVKEIDVLKA